MKLLRRYYTILITFVEQSLSIKLAVCLLAFACLAAVLVHTDAQDLWWTAVLIVVFRLITRHFTHHPLTSAMGISLGVFFSFLALTVLPVITNYLDGTIATIASVAIVTFAILFSQSMLRIHSLASMGFGALLYFIAVSFIYYPYGVALMLIGETICLYVIIEVLFHLRSQPKTVQKSDLHTQ